MQMTGSIHPAVNTLNPSNLLFNSLSSRPSLTSRLSSTLHHICFSSRKNEADENIQDKSLFFFLLIDSIKLTRFV